MDTSLYPFTPIVLQVSGCCFRILYNNSMNATNEKLSMDILNYNKYIDTITN
jgi:hypothetical protein